MQPTSKNKKIEKNDLWMDPWVRSKNDWRVSASSSTGIRTRLQSWCLGDQERDPRVLSFESKDCTGWSQSRGSACLEPLKWIDYASWLLKRGVLQRTWSETDINDWWFGWGLYHPGEFPERFAETRWQQKCLEKFWQEKGEGTNNRFMNHYSVGNLSDYTRTMPPKSLKNTWTFVFCLETSKI